ncbi:Uncharacterised protein [Mycobacteroides abscessus subsp. abscessus]|nr:Uncharacterised protein [Mycobacteroides abscessus subsp. abscessus]
MQLAGIPVRLGDRAGAHRPACLVHELDGHGLAVGARLDEGFGHHPTLSGPRCDLDRARGTATPDT